MSTYIMALKEEGQMGYEKIRHVGLKAETDEQAYRKAREWADRRTGNSQYRYTLLSVYRQVDINPDWYE